MSGASKRWVSLVVIGRQDNIHEKNVRRNSENAPGQTSVAAGTSLKRPSTIERPGCSQYGPSGRVEFDGVILLHNGRTQLVGPSVVVGYQRFEVGVPRDRDLTIPLNECG